MAQLIIAPGTENERVVGLRPESEMTIGRSEKADVPISEPKASRSHCIVRHDGTNYWVIDMASRNGTYVNGKRVNDRPLLDGDRIMIGKTIIKLIAPELKAQKTSAVDEE